MVALLERRIIESLQDGPFVQGESPDEMDSGGLGPCIALGAIYRTHGFLVHGVPGSCNFESHIYSTLDAVSKVVKAKRFLKLYVAGGSFFQCMSAGDREDTLEKRQWVLNAIAAHGYAKCLKECRWGDLRETLAITLFLEHREGFIESKPDQDFEEDGGLSQRYYEEYFGSDKNNKF